MKTVTLFLTVQVFYRKVLLKYGKCSRMLQSRTPYLAESYLEIGCQGNQVLTILLKRYTIIVSSLLKSEKLF